MLAAMKHAVARSWRTWLYELLTYVGTDRLRRTGHGRRGRWITRAAQRLLGGGSVEVRGGAGSRLRLATDHLAIDHEQGYGLLRGVLEPEVQEALRRHVAPGATVFDVGANIGFFSLLAAALAGPTGRVEAFEPVPANAEATRANAALNGFHTVTVHEVAVSDHQGFERLCVPAETSWAHLADRGWHRDTEREFTVPLVVLDQEIAEGRVPVPSVVKIDVEGSEVSVLSGLRETLAANDLIVICELHRTNDEVVHLMSALGYTAENLEGTADVAAAGPVHVLLRRA